MFRLPLIVLALGVVAGPAHAAAPACWDYAAGGWEAAGAIPGPEPVRALALTGDGRLLGGFAAGVGILDLDDPAAPVSAASCPPAPRSSGWPPTGTAAWPWTPTACSGTAC